MKLVILAILFFVTISAIAQNVEKPVYIGKWNGSEAKFKSPYVLIFNDTNVLLIRKNMFHQKAIRIDTAVFAYKARQITNGYEFTLSAPQATMNKDKTLLASFLINNSSANSNQLKANFSIDFGDGSGKPSTLRLKKII